MSVVESTIILFESHPSHNRDPRGSLVVFYSFIFVLYGREGRIVALLLRYCGVITASSWRRYGVMMASLWRRDSGAVILSQTVNRNFIFTRRNFSTNRNILFSKQNRRVKSGGKKHDFYSTDFFLKTNSARMFSFLENIDDSKVHF